MNLQEVIQWYDFSGKTIVITGGTGVLGGEMACALVGCGANVAVLDRNPDLPDYLKAADGRRSGQIHGCLWRRAASANSWNWPLRTIQAAFGDIDMLINAAGGNHPTGHDQRRCLFL